MSRETGFGFVSVYFGLIFLGVAIVVAIMAGVYYVAEAVAQATGLSMTMSIVFVVGVGVGLGAQSLKLICRPSIMGDGG